MKLRCTKSNSINFSAGFEYIAEVDAFMSDDEEMVDVVHGAYTWFYFNKADLTATKRNGAVIATFENSTNC